MIKFALKQKKEESKNPKDTQKPLETRNRKMFFRVQQLLKYQFFQVKEILKQIHKCVSLCVCTVNDFLKKFILLNNSEKHFT